MTPQEKGNMLYNYIQDKAIVSPSLTITPNSTEIYFEYLGYSFNMEILPKQDYKEVEVRIDIKAPCVKFPEFNVHTTNQAYWQYQGELQKNNEEMMGFLKELNEKFELGLNIKGAKNEHANL